MVRKPRHDESAIQQACVKWFRLAYPKLSKMLFAVPNGGKRGALEALMFQREGVVPGVADLILLLPSCGGVYRNLCIEMKTVKGTQSAYQKEWQEAAESVGNKYVIVRSLDQFMAEVSAYIGR